MIRDDLLPEYSGWSNTRTKEPLSLAQYLGHVLDKGGSPASLVIALLNLAVPEMRQQGEYVFLEELFSQSKFEDLIAQGKQPEDIEYWMNLLGLSATFDVLTDSQLDYVARTLQKLWANRLLDLGIEGYECRLLFDDEEWYLTICRKRV